MKIGLIGVGSIVSHGIRSISSYLKSHGHKIISVYFARIECYITLPLQEFIKKDLNKLLLLMEECDIIGISCTSLNTYEAIHIINLLKPLGKPIIWGGIQVNLCPEFCLKYTDIICIGEGENALLNLINKIENKEYIYNTPNFWFKHNGDIIKNLPGPLIENLDELPTPDFEFENSYVFNGNQIIPRKDLFLPVIYIYTVYGCPHKCTFCCNVALYKSFCRGRTPKQKLRKKSINKIIQDLIKIKSHLKKVERVNFHDDTFFIHTLDEIKEFCKQYKEYINLPFTVYGSPKTLTEKKLKMLVDIGLETIDLGIQSGSENINKNLYKRNTSTQDILKAVNLINKYQDKMLTPPTYDVIINNPYEKPYDTFKTLEILYKIPKPYFLVAFNLKFFPGTELYEKALIDGIINDLSIILKSLNNETFLLGPNMKDDFVDINDVISLMNGLVSSEFYGKLPSKLIEDFVNRGFYFKTKIIIPQKLFNLIIYEQPWKDLIFLGMNLYTFLVLLKVITFLRYNPSENEQINNIIVTYEDYKTTIETMKNFWNYIMKSSTKLKSNLNLL